MSAVYVSKGVLLAGGLQGQLLRSTDRGESWYRGRAPQLPEVLISCLTASPTFRRDGVVLAGTDGAGVLRSTNGGADWQLTNFGLEDLRVVALATAPGEDQLGVPYHRVGRWLAFAATTTGLYRSPNGGRAWQQLDLGSTHLAVQALAVSPTFAQDGVVFAGTEAHGLFRSEDRGQTWTALDLGLESPPAINALWLHPAFAETSICLIGTADGRLLRSEDGGAHWEVVYAGDAAVLTLGGMSALYAGLYEGGVLCSDDFGVTWSPLPLHARPFVRLNAERAALLAWGPQVGPRQSEDGGQTWAPLRFPEGRIPLAATGDDGWLIGTDAGLFRQAEDGQWTRHLPEQCITALAKTSAGLFVGSRRGEVFRSEDDGRHWDTLGSPSLFRPILALDADGPLTVATTVGPSQSLIVWLWDATNHGWKQWHRVQSMSASAHLCMSNGTIWAALGHTLWRATPQGWEKILETERPIVRLQHDLLEERRYVLTRRRIFSTTDDTTFETLTSPVEANTLMDLVVATVPHALYLLTVGGGLWRHPL
jgi:photosystem II stability/assembly factor-like uncharacterized protein